MKIKSTLFLLAFVILSNALSAQTVKLFAGIQNDVDPNTKVENSTVALANVHFYKPEGIAWDKNGNMWITERNKIRLYIGGQFYNRAGSLGDGDMTQSYQNGTGIGMAGSGTGAAFYAPTAIVSDASGNFFIMDSENHAIRKMLPFGNVGNGQEVSTFAGAPVQTGNVGLAGTTNATGTAARFDVPKGVVIDASGTMYVTEFNNFTIRKVTSAGVVTTLAGKIAVQGSADGTGTNASFAGPYGIAKLDANYVVISDADNGTIRKVHMNTGEVVTICGKAGDNRYEDGGFTAARFNNPKGLAVVDGKIYVCDGPMLRVIDINAKTVATFAGSTNTGNKDGEGAAATFGELVGMAYDGKISLYVTDHYYNVIKTVTINSLAPTVDFTANKTKAVVDAEILTFTNTSAGKPATTLKWTVTPITYTITTGTLTTAPLSIKFTATGFYNVSLDVTNAYGTGNKVKPNYISVSTVGINEIPENVTVGVYPNPSNGVFTIQSLYGNFPIQEYEVLDITGKLIISKLCSNSATETVDISKFNNGFYFLRVKASNRTTTLKLQKI